MFEHSIRVPRLYKTAANIAQKVKEEGASVKQLVYEKKHPNLKALYALVTEVLKNGNRLDSLLRATKLLLKETRLDPWLARVLITELLWGKKRLAGESKPVQTILSYQEELTNNLSNISDATTSSKSKKVKKPRYVRVNTIKISLQEVIEIFRNDGWLLLRCGDNSDYAAYLATVSSLSEDQFIIDFHIKDLLVFAPNTQFYQHPLYQNGEIILQDKASCLSPFFLNPSRNSTILDMCAAPGMKTSQLASLVGESGKVFAVERDQRRFKTLAKLIEDIGGINVTCINKDVLTITSKDIPDVEYILVDPSCSGSGMLDRFEFEDRESKCNESRLRSLAGFQITLLRHALLNFPKVKRVVYSTCSVYPEENEEVVKQVLSSVKNFKLVSLKEKMLNNWYNFGSKDFEDIGEFCLYAKPEQDLTNGFFVAVFERLSEGEINKHFVKPIRRTSENQGNENDNEITETSEVNKTTKKHKKKDKKNKVDNESITEETETPETTKKCKKSKKDKKKKELVEENIVEETVEKKKKSKKRKRINSETNDNNVETKEKSVEEITDETIAKKSKKKKKNKE